MMVAIGESFSPEAADKKAVIFRVKRKAGNSPLDAFCLEISERPAKRRTFLDFEKLSISDSDSKEDVKPKKLVVVRRVETDNSRGKNEGMAKGGHERRKAFKRHNGQDQLLSKAIQQHCKTAEISRLERLWRRRKGNMNIDDPPKQDSSFVDRKMLASYLSLLREYVPSAAEEIESAICESDWENSFENILKDSYIESESDDEDDLWSYR